MNCLTNAQYDHKSSRFVVKESGITYHLTQKHIDNIKYKIGGRRPNITLKEWYNELPANDKKAVTVQSDHLYND